MQSNSIIDHARIIWDYHLVKHELEPADGILVFGSNDPRVAEHAAGLYHQKLAPYILFSGGAGRMTEGIFHKAEAETFAEIAAGNGVPEENILIEKESTNSGENISFSRNLLRERGLTHDNLIIVQKPYMERRVYAAMRKQWPDAEIKVTSPDLSFDDYPTEQIPCDDLIHMIVGDFQRIVTYPALGFQIEQPVPHHVKEAYCTLVEAGYTNHITNGGALS